MTVASGELFAFRDLIRLSFIMNRIVLCFTAHKLSPHPTTNRQQLGIIYKACKNPKIRHAMFSATYQSHVEDWCRLHLDNLIQVTVGVKNASVKTIEQKIKFVGNKDGKILALREIVKGGIKPPVLVFTEVSTNSLHLFGL
jgi:ATP-dependent RNA helicase DDX52/ROK1